MQVLLNELKAARIFTSSDDSRYAICGVRIECVKGKRPLLIATDAARLLVIQSNAPICEMDEARTIHNEAIDVIESISGITRGIEETKISIEPEKDSRTAVFSLSGKWKHKMTDAIIDVTDTGKFPNWRFVIPKHDENSMAQRYLINGTYMEDFSKAVKLVDRKTEAALCFYVYSALSAMVVRRNDCERFFGLIMPIRWHGKEDGMPKNPLLDWLELDSTNKSIDDVAAI